MTPEQRKARALEILEAPAKNREYLDHAQDVVDEANAAVRLARRRPLRVIR